MESPPNKTENTACRPDVPPRYLPFLEAGFWPAATPISPFLIGRDMPPFWPVPWLPHLWSSAHPPLKHQDSSPTRQHQLSSSSSVTSPIPDEPLQHASSEPGMGPSFRTPSLSNSPVLHGAPGLAVNRGRTAGGFVDPIIALTSMEAASPVISRALASALPRRPRSEKRPIPDEQKDDKYFERRKRNNAAAKKSRDALKQREDEVALRACFLEKENAILRAQVATLREEAHSLRQMMMLQKRDWCKQ